MAQHASRIERAVTNDAAIVPSRVAPLLKASVALISHFLHRRIVIQRPGRALLGCRRRTYPASLQESGPSILERFDEPLRMPKIPPPRCAAQPDAMSLISGEGELGDMHTANAALASLRRRREWSLPLVTAGLRLCLISVPAPYAHGSRALGCRLSFVDRSMIWRARDLDGGFSRPRGTNRRRSAPGGRLTQSIPQRR